MNPKISTHWSRTERRFVIGLLEKKLTKLVTADEIEIIMRKIEFLKNNSATALEADSEWLLEGLDVQRVEVK